MDFFLKMNGLQMSYYESVYSDYYKVMVLRPLGEVDTHKSQDTRLSFQEGE